MRFFRLKSSGWLRAAVLAVFLASMAPSPAYALDLGGLLNGLLTGIGGFFSALTTTLMGLFDRSTTGTIQGLHVLYEGQRRLTQWQVQENYRMQLGSALAAASRDFRPPSNYQCAVATDERNDPVRTGTETMASNTVNRIMSTVFDDPETGTPITQEKLQMLFCKLKVIGQQPPPGCNVAIDRNVRGADVNFAAAIGDKFCIPFDEDSLINEMRNAIRDPRGYSPTENNRLAFIAILFIRKSLGTHCAWPRNRQMIPITGVTATDDMADVLNRRYAKNQALQNALRYHLCFSQRMLPNCRTDDQGLFRYLNEKFPGGAAGGEPTFMPQGDFCLSRWQKDWAYTIRDTKVKGEEYSEGTNVDRDIFYATLTANIERRIAAHTAVMNAASAAHATSTNERACPRTDAPMR